MSFDLEAWKSERKKLNDMMVSRLAGLMHGYWPPPEAREEYWLRDEAIKEVERLTKELAEAREDKK